MWQSVQLTKVFGITGMSPSSAVKTSRKKSAKIVPLEVQRLVGQHILNITTAVNIQCH